MQFYTFDDTTYPGIPNHTGPEIKLTNRFCDPELAAQTYQEHHFTYCHINPSSTVLAAALITRTKWMEAGVIGHVLPLRIPSKRQKSLPSSTCSLEDD